MEDDETYADEARELQEEASGNQSAFSAFTGFLGGLFGGSKAKSTQPAVKIFSTKTFSDGITYADKPADGKISEGTCVDIRRRFVASVERALKENGIPDRNRVGFIQELSAALLADDVKGKPLEVNVSLSYGDGVKNFLANKFLSKVLDGVLSGKVNGAGVASGPDDSIASISIDPLQVLGKLAIKIPGETPEITTVALDQNGLSVGINF